MNPITDLYTDPREHRPFAAAVVRALLWLAVLALLLGPWLAGSAHGQEADRFEPSVRGGRDAVEQWRPLVEQYDWDADTALAIIRCESKGDPGATNPTSGAAGLFQLYGWDRFASRLFGRWVSVYDPAVNTRVAYALYVDSGERFGFHWAASAGCWR